MLLKNLYFAVGSGSAGSVVAARLAEISDWKILVLEAGQQASAISKIPGLHLLLMTEEADENWHYKTTPQKHSMYNYKDKVQRTKTVVSSQTLLKMTTV